MMRLLARTLLILSIAVGLSTVTTPTHADGTKEAKYSMTKKWVGTKSCIKVTLKGKIRGTTSFYVSQYGHLVSTLKNPRIVSPSMTIVVNANKKCTGKRRTVTKATLRQMWYYDSCSANPSIGVSYPWGVSVSATPTCGTKRAAHRSTTYGKGSKYTQNTSGTAGTWKKSTTSGGKLCIRAVADVTNYRGTTSYSKRLNMGRACLSI